MPADPLPVARYRQALGKRLLSQLAPCDRQFLGPPVYHSLRCQPGGVYVALKGAEHDGHDFFSQAVAQGARLLVGERPPPSSLAAGVGYWQVADSRRALSVMAATAYDSPSQKVRVVGVTGTDGKTSVCYFIYQLLTGLGVKTGLLSTFALDDGDGLRANPQHQTTPESVEVQGFLAQACAHGYQVVVLESSSHGLSAKTSRLADVQFSTGVFTNLSPEHLEFHLTMDQYAQDKSRLFQQLKGQAVLNTADKYAPLMMAAAAPHRCWTYGGPHDDLRLLESRTGIEGSDALLRFQRRSQWVHLPIPGTFYLDNLALALLACHAETGQWAEALAGTNKLVPPTGRMQRVLVGQDFTAIIDYAHSPGSFARLLPELRRYTPGKFVVVFGSGGERDLAKRPLQGQLADRYADKVVLTDEDPRNEDRHRILQDIAAGVRTKTRGKDLLLVPDRREAIALACKDAGKGDTVVLLGKGHERSIISAGAEQPWNEEQAFKDAISTRTRG